MGMWSTLRLRLWHLQRGTCTLSCLDFSCYVPNITSTEDESKFLGKLVMASTLNNMSMCFETICCLLPNLFTNTVTASL